MIPPKVYEGNEPYIFVSYSHKDIDAVWKLIEALNKKGFRIWYDDGIGIGSEFDDIISAKIRGCEALISYNTDNLFTSSYCKQELLFAARLQKKIINIAYTADEPDWYVMRFATTYQQVYGNKYADVAMLADALMQADLIRNCREEGENVESKKTGIPVPDARVLHYDNGDKYEGEVKNGKRDGYGVCYYVNGDYYEGSWQNDKKHGRGKYYYEKFNNGYYDGEWIDDKEHGKGIFYRSDGTIAYSGDWKYGKEHGKGTSYYHDGKTVSYIGDWAVGVRHGKGTSFHPDGSKDYEGMWHIGKEC